MRLKLLLSLAAAVCVLAISSTAFGKPAPAVDGRVSAVQPVQKEASSTIPSSAYPNGGVELLRTGDPLNYTSIVVEQDSTTGELLQRLRVEQHTGTYACRDIPDVEDERCCSESLSQKLRMHRIQ
ncbi:MAG: hypothetical protein KDD64_16855, partial [Bdellovibrionales bacterium]|nr:hypothetical protein [Bdellovibrionales bacterium]